MCGIAGLINRADQSQTAKWIYQMTSVMRHRGPDDEGYVLATPLLDHWVSCYGGDTDPVLVSGQSLTALADLADQPFSIALGFRRLSIIDLSLTGHQPMSGLNARYWIVYNGEIYNYLELRSQLIGMGYSFHSSSDTEVILNAYDCWGKDMLQRLEGMFAFAIADCKRGTLFLARDFFGIKPLYYTFSQEQFAFSSEIKPLLQLPWVKRKVNPDRLYQYLCYSKSDYGGETFFQDINQLPAAHYLEIDFRQPGLSNNPVRYWQISTSEQSLSPAEAAEQIRKRFFHNIELHIRSDVPTGSALSGGIDSSSIVMAMRHLMQPGQELHTFSYLAESSAYNEASWSDMVAKCAMTNHHTIQLQPEVLTSEIIKLIDIQEEPFGGTSILAQSKVFALARQVGIKVLLDGQGADEFLAGYPFYNVYRLISLIRGLEVKKGFEFLREVQNRCEVNAGMIPFIVASNFLPTAIRSFLRQMVKHDVLPGWLNTQWFQERGITLRPLERKAEKSALKSELIWSILETSLPMLLRYEDRNSMSHSIESRVPFLTPDFVNFVLSLPEDYLIGTDGTTKYIFRKAMKGVVPQPILDRRDKIGFKTPEESWLRKQTSWVQSVLDSETAHAIPAFHLPVVQRMCQQALSGQLEYNTQVWRWINVIQWAQHFSVEFGT